MTVPIELSVIIPVFNEAESIALLFKEVRVALSDAYALNQYEIIVVDDGSSDETSTVLDQDDTITVLTFNRNQGQSAAMMAGIDNSTGNLIVFLDGDGQNNPDDICRMIDQLLLGNSDLICGWRIHRQDSFSKRFISKGAYSIRQRLIKDGIHDSGCTIKVGYRVALQSIKLHGELHRLIPALMILAGYRVSEIHVDHRPRLHGKTKYTFTRVVKGFIDISQNWFWKKYETRPMHFFGTIGGFSLAFGIFSGLSSIFFYLAGISLWRNSLPILASLFILAGIQILLTGLIADRIFRLQYVVSNEPRYKLSNVRKRIT